MRLSHKVDKILVAVAVFVLSLTFVLMARREGDVKTFAESEAGLYTETDEHYVTFYDEGEKLIVKTDAVTVGEALERAGYIINTTDIVEPSQETKITSDNFFINIYRSQPAVVRDGLMQKYVMTASRDARAIAQEAGLTIYDGDEIRLVPSDNFMETGVANVYEIIRNGGRTVTEQEAIDFTEETVKDYNLEPGMREVRQLGEVGTRELVYEVFYENGIEVKRELVSETVVREPVSRIVAVGASAIEQHPLTAGMGRNYYIVTKADGTTVLRQETFYDLDMGVVIGFCGSSYSVREDGVKVDQDGYVLVAANLSLYPRCSVVETSLGPGKVYDTGAFAASNPEQFDLATDWSNHNGR